VKILVFPREDANPYQRLLYGELEKLGVRAAYLGRLTPSHTLNLLLLPFELAAGRLRGARIVHLHWVYAFAVTGAGRFPALRVAALAWFAAWLLAVRLLGLRLVWTAHNALPHAPVFADDVRARRRLVAACDLVIAHAATTLTELAALGAVPRRSAVIPHGPFAPASPATPLHPPGQGTSLRRLLFFGKVEAYKGIDDLVAAFAALPADVEAGLTIAGECRDPAVRSALRDAAAAAAGRIALRLDWIPDGEVSRLLAEADAVVLPYRRVSTSGSAVLALCHGRPLIVPDLAAFADLPDAAIVRYDRTAAGLTAALHRLAQAGSDELAAMSAAAVGYAGRLGWPDIAARTAAELSALVSSRPRARSDGSMLTAR
jgi:glycosyltransferase involved in cell wall biosynthesis